jgi:hypothetical protein
MRRSLGAAARSAGGIGADGSSRGLGAGAANAVPKSLLGRWTRRLTLAQVIKTGNPYPGIWSMTIKANGQDYVQSPSAAGDYQQLSFPSPGKLSFRSPFCTPHPTGLYAWKISGKKLTLTKVKDLCGDRAAVAAGVWTRK